MDIAKTNDICDYIKTLGWDITQIKQIAYGAQISAVKCGLKSNIRMYENKKGAITVDTSQVKDENLTAALSGFAVKKQTDGNASNTKDIIVAPPLIGSDEAGKGDYLGALTIGAVYADEKMFGELIAAGVKDSKKLSNDAVSRLAEEIKRICPNVCVVAIKNKRFNEMYDKCGNINEILAWAHTTAIKKLIADTGCKNILIDKFGTGERTKRRLTEPGIILTQEPKAERNAAVAAASILARDAYMKDIKEKSDMYGIDFVAGAGEAADDAARLFVKKYGAEKLCDIAKISFKNTEKVTK